MGLDMSLNGRRFIASWGGDAERALSQDIRSNMHDAGITLPESADIQNIEVEFISWRKANAIHKWFVTNVQDGADDCDDYVVEWDQLAELKDLCDKVIADPELATELLPTGSGFFFGVTDYDADYIGDLKYTSERISELLAWYASEKLSNTEWRWSLYYTSS